MNNLPTNTSKEDFFMSRGYEWAEVEPIIRLYKFYKRAQGEIDTEHHLIPKVRGGSEVKQNKKKLKAKDHWAHHRNFENKTPGEQFEQVLAINSTILAKDVKKRMGEIIFDTKGGLYIPRAYT